MLQNIVIWFDKKDYRFTALNAFLFLLSCTWYGSTFVLVLGSWCIILGILLYCISWQILYLYRTTIKGSDTLMFDIYQILLAKIPLVVAIMLSIFASYIILRSEGFSFQYFSGAGILSFEVLILILIANEMKRSRGNWMNFLHK